MTPSANHYLIEVRTIYRVAIGPDGIRRAERIETQTDVIAPSAGLYSIEEAAADTDPA